MKFGKTGLTDRNFLSVSSFILIEKMWADKIPQLEQMAYGRYQDERDEMRRNLSTLMSQDETAYNRYLDEEDALYRNLMTLLEQDDRAYGRHMDDFNKTQSVVSTLMARDNEDYDRYRNEQNDALNRWQLNYGVDRDKLSDQRYEEEQKKEQERGGDYGLSGSVRGGAAA